MMAGWGLSNPKAAWEAAAGRGPATLRCPGANEGRMGGLNRSRLKGGCGRDWPPHTEQPLLQPETQATCCLRVWRASGPPQAGGLPYSGLVDD
jgi:hypothetical protein